MTKQERWTLVATVLGSGIVFLDGTVVNLALPTLSHDLGATFSDLQWIVDGYLLSLSALILFAGSLGDIFGRKRVYLIGLAGFGITSILCGLASTSLLLIVARILQGIAAALLVPGGLAILNATISPQYRSVAIGRWAAWSGIATVVGPLIGGFLIDTLSWRGIFFINIPFVIVCFILALLYIRESKDDRPRSIDYAGSLLAAGFLSLMTYGLIEGPAAKWGIDTLLPLIAGIFLLAVFLVVEYYKRDPLVDLRLFAIRNFSGVNITTFAMYGALSGFFFALIIYLQTALHYSSVEAGLALLPATILLIVFSGRMGTLTERYGARIFMTVGPMLAAVGIFLFLLLAPGSSYLLGVLPGILLFGVGLTLTVTPLSVTVMNAVSHNDSGIASGINNAISRVAGLIAVAFLGIFGAEHMYQFAVYLCATLALCAGIVSFFLIRTPRK